MFEIMAVLPLFEHVFNISLSFSGRISLEDALVYTSAGLSFETECEIFYENRPWI